MHTIKKNKALNQIIQNSITTRKVLPFYELSRGITRLFRGIIHFCFGSFVPRFLINVSCFGVFLSRFGVIHLFRRNILSFQRIIHLFRGIIHSRRGIKLSCFGSFLSLSEINPSLSGVFDSCFLNLFGFKAIKTLIYG